jgi:hypothetical protein
MPLMLLTSATSLGLLLLALTAPGEESGQPSPLPDWSDRR